MEARTSRPLRVPQLHTAGAIRRLSVKRLFVCAVAIFVAGTINPAQTAVDVAIDVGANRRPIDPRIYGVAHADAAAVSDLRVAFHRWGGNASTRHNWQANATNRAGDWFFESIADGPAVAGQAADTFIDLTKMNGAQPLITIPTMGWVAKMGSSRNNLASFSVAKYGAQTAVDQWFPDAGNGVSVATGRNITGNDPNDANVPSDATFQRGWVQHLVTRWGASNAGGVRYYALDNEPSIWHSTHRDVHPNGASMDEVFNASVAHATQIKSVDPNAQVLGPEEWGWSGYLYSGRDLQWGQANGWANLPDRAAHGGADYVPWYLSQFRQRDTTAGQRLLDVFTLHYYPQGGEYGSDTSTAVQLRRNRSTRSLWDPTYVDETWIGTQVQLIPRMKNWVTANYPGLQTGITEYNWGAENHINGATTQADILGIFGREGLDLATYWTAPASSTPTYKAFKMYRNYDGQGAAFGETSVSALTPNPDSLSVFAAQRTSGVLTVMAVNKDLSSSPSVNFRLQNFNAANPVQVWRLTSANAINRLGDASVAAGTLSATLPAQSITLFVIPAAAGQTTPTAPTNLRIITGAVTVPASVAATGGGGQTAAPNTLFSAPLRATVRDSNSNPVSGVMVTFTAPASGASARFSGSATATAVTDSSGVAQAPALTANGTTGSYAVTASVSGVAGTAAFALTNTPQGTGGSPGQWSNVTPSGICLTPGCTYAGSDQNFGVQGVHADPARPGTLYAPVTYQGLWKSTDYGLTWSKVVVTSGPAPMDSSRGNICIAPDGSYIIGAALYPNNGIQNGAWKSTDGGKTWTRYNTGATFEDLQHLAINPNDKNRVIASPHSPPYVMFESRDGGQTFTNMGPVGNTTFGHYFWVDDNTILVISDGEAGPGPGTWRGVRSGSTWPWTWTWTRVSNQQHWHGSSQAFVDPGGTEIFTGGAYGVQKSTDKGLTWTVVSTRYSAGIVATPNNLYSTSNYASNAGFGPDLQHASRATGGTSWVADPPPPGMNNGWIHAATVFDGSKWIVISGNWLAGIWRVVEQ
jgi:hypothetical protein